MMVPPASQTAPQIQQRAENGNGEIGGNASSNLQNFANQNVGQNTIPTSSTGLGSNPGVDNFNFNSYP